MPNFNRMIACLPETKVTKAELIQLERNNYQFIIYMDTLSLSQLIITSFKYYDISCNTYNKYINIQNIKFKQHPDTRIISKDKLIIFDNTFFFINCPT